MTEKQRKYCEGYHFVSTLDKLPNTVHYAVLEEDTVRYPDPYEDTNRGGTAYITDRVIKYIGFDDEAALNDYIMKQQDHKYGPGKTYKVIQVTPVEVKLHTTIEIKR